METRKKLSAVLLAGGLAFGMAACETENGGTSPGIEDGTGGGVGTEPGAGGGTATDPLAPADDTGGVDG